MLNDIKAVYAAAWRAMLVMPLLFAIPVVVEFAQHVVEMRIGMYDSLAMAKQVADDPMRMLFGFAKAVALLLPGYWFVRLMAFGDGRRAARPEAPAFALWLVLFAMNVAILAWEMFGPPLGSVIGLAGQSEKLAGPVLSAAWMVIGIYFTAWFVGWTLGNRAIGPRRSFAIMTGSFWRTVGYMLACILPLMALHYALGYLAVTLTPALLDWVVLALDAAVGGLLACCMAGAGYIAAARAAARKGASLIE